MTNLSSNSRKPQTWFPVRSGKNWTPETSPLWQEGRQPCVKMLTFIAVSEYHTESQKHSEYTQKLYNNIWFHRGSEHIPYYNLQKSTLQKFKILNIKKYNCRNRCRTGTRNCSGWKSVRQQGDATIQNKAGVPRLHLQLALETTTGGRNRNRTQKNAVIWNDHINYGRSMHPEGIILQQTPLQVACYSIIQWDW